MINAVTLKFDVSHLFTAMDAYIIILLQLHVDENTFKVKAEC